MRDLEKDLKDDLERDLIGRDLGRSLRDDLEEAIMEKMVDIEARYDRRHYEYYIFMDADTYQRWLDFVNSYMFYADDPSPARADFNDIERFRWMGFDLYVKVIDNIQVPEGYSIIAKDFKEDERSKVRDQADTQAKDDAE